MQPVLDAGLAQFVEQDHRISPELRLIPTPGHTPGHVSVVIESKGEVAMITGDMMHHPCQIARPQWSARVDADKKTAMETRHRLIAEWTSRPMLVIGTHFTTPTAGRVRRDEDGGHWFEGV